VGDLRCKVKLILPDGRSEARWKSQIFDYQQRTRESVPPQQTALFDIAPKHCNPELIDPISLPVRRRSPRPGIALVLPNASRQSRRCVFVFRC